MGGKNPPIHKYMPAELFIYFLVPKGGLLAPPPGLPGFFAIELSPPCLSV